LVKKEDTDLINFTLGWRFSQMLLMPKIKFVGEEAVGLTDINGIVLLSNDGYYLMPLEEEV
jgi:hypothetical protein